MALYVPAGARRRRLVLGMVLALVVGLGIGYVAGRATSPGLADEVTDVQDLARDAATALQRIPIEYEQALAGEGGESTSTITGAIDRAERQLGDAYAEAIWLRDDASSITARGFELLAGLVDDGVDAGAFESAIGVLVDQIEGVFGITAGPGG
jgi:hypothetical protein